MESDKSALNARVSVLERQMERLGNMCFAQQVILRAVADEVGSRDLEAFLNMASALEAFRMAHRTENEIFRALIEAHERWFEERTALFERATDAGLSPGVELRKHFERHKHLTWPTYLALMGEFV